MNQHTKENYEKSKSKILRYLKSHGPRPINNIVNWCYRPESMVKEILQELINEAKVYIHKQGEGEQIFYSTERKLSWGVSLDSLDELTEIERLRDQVDYTSRQLKIVEQQARYNASDVYDINNQLTLFKNAITAIQANLIKINDLLDLDDTNNIYGE